MPKTIDFNLRCGQMIAQRSQLKDMNIAQRHALWFRLERIGQPVTKDGGRIQFLEERMADFEQQLYRIPNNHNLLALKGELNFLINKLNTHIDASRKKKGGKYIA